MYYSERSITMLTSPPAAVPGGGSYGICESGCVRPILVAMDNFTKWPEGCSVPNQTAVTMANTLVEEMFCHFGALEELHIDQGRIFFQEVCMRLKKRKKNPHHPLHLQNDRGWWNIIIARWLHSWLSSLASTSMIGTNTYPWACGLTVQRYRSPPNACPPSCCLVWN